MYRTGGGRPPLRILSARPAAGGSGMAALHRRLCVPRLHLRLAAAAAAPPGAGGLRRGVERGSGGGQEGVDRSHVVREDGLWVLVGPLVDGRLCRPISLSVGDWQSPRICSVGVVGE
eukprot:325576-Prorocentrum_minimum.AAC.1